MAHSEKASGEHSHTFLERVELWVLYATAIGCIAIVVAHELGWLESAYVKEQGPKITLTLIALSALAVASITRKVERLPLAINERLSALQLGVTSTLGEHQKAKHEVMTAALVAQYYRDHLPTVETSSVYAERLREIAIELEGIKRGKIALTRQQLEDLSTKLLLRRGQDTSRLADYVATHIVNSPERASMWSEPDEHLWMKRYIRPQETIVRNGGSLKRVFVFDRDWMFANDENLGIAERVLSSHELLFRDAVDVGGKTASVGTYACFAMPQYDQEDITILNGMECFLWIARRDTGPIAGYFLDCREEVLTYLRQFNEIIASDASEAADFLARVRGQRSRAKR